MATAHLANDLRVTRTPCRPLSRASFINSAYHGFTPVALCFRPLHGLESMHHLCGDIPYINLPYATSFSLPAKFSLRPLIA